MTETSRLNVEYWDIVKSDDMLAIADLYLMYQGQSLHKTTFSKETIDNAITTLYNKPVVCTLCNNNEDFTNHIYAVNDNDWKKQMDLQKTFGTIPESSNIEYVEKDGKTFLKCSVIIWKYYHPQVYEALLNRSGNVKISIEILIKEKQDLPDGSWDVKEFSFVGVCLLGMNIQEAFPGAELIVEKYSSDELMVKSKEFYSNYLDEINFYSQEDIGTKTPLKVDTSKEAMSESEWGLVDKSAMADRIIASKNFKEIAPKVFLQLLDGWEDGLKGSLKYPIMQLKGDTLVYNRYGISSAEGYATKNNEADVLSKINKIKKHLGLDEKGEMNSMAEKTKTEVTEVEEEKTKTGETPDEKIEETPVKEEKPMEKNSTNENFELKFNELSAKYALLEIEKNKAVEQLNSVTEELKSYKDKENLEKMSTAVKTELDKFSKLLTDDEQAKFMEMCSVDASVETILMDIYKTAAIKGTEITPEVNTVPTGFSVFSLANDGISEIKEENILDKLNRICK